MIRASAVPLAAGQLAFPVSGGNIVCGFREEAQRPRQTPADDQRAAEHHAEHRNSDAHEFLLQLAKRLLRGRPRPQQHQPGIVGSGLHGA